MTIDQNVLSVIGNTPLLKLQKASEMTGCTILGKCEFLNPGQSVKDRPALNIIEQAMKNGEIAAGGTVVEGTAGNTGIGLTVVANALGLKSVIVIPDTQSQEKKDTLRLLGATLIEVPAKPYRNPNNFVHYSNRLAEKLARELDGGAVWANQFDNVANRDSHIKTTAQEIWQQTDGKLDGFVCAVGSGGTLGGVSIGLKELNKDIQIGIADPHGAGLYSFYTTGEVAMEGSSIAEGIGQVRITKNLEDIFIDHAFRIDDAAGIKIVFELLQQEGLCLGLSSGINVAGAIELAKKMGPGHTIVTILADYGNRYQSKLFNPEFLAEKDLPVPSWLEAANQPKMPDMFLEVEES
jgi:cysteine synthase A